MKQNRRAFLRNGALAAGAMTLRSVSKRSQLAASSVPGPAAAETQGVNSVSIRRMFQEPPKKYRPLARWWWPGDDVTEPELRREVAVLDQAGFGGAEVQAFIKGFPVKELPEAQLARMNGFATPSFFRHVASAADEARNRGMFIDYTFGSGWPFGGGEAITPEFASIELRSTYTSVRGPAQLSQKLQVPSVTDGDLTNGSEKLAGLPPGWAERMKKRTKLVAVVAVRGEDAQWEFHQGGGPRHTVVKSGKLEKGTSIDLTARLGADGTLSWDVPEGTWQVFVFCSLPTAQRVNAGAGDSPQLVMDHLSAAAFQAHAKRIGDEAIPYLGEFFGNGLRAIFCDSLEVSANLFWSDDFLSEFKQRRGYDLVPYLPILKVQDYREPFGEFVDLPLFDIAEIGEQVRFDYRQTVSDLMRERFYDKFNEWAHDHKLLSRTQAHGAPVDVLRVYEESDIPETEQLFDLGCYDFLKMAASAANVCGRAIVGSESFVWPTAAYQTTPEKMKVAADELVTAGVNAIVYHGFPYIVPGLQPPGWHPFIGYYGEGNYSSQFNELNPFWPYIAQINAYITRLQFLSQVGTNVAAVALYRNDLVHGADEAPPSPKLNQALLDAGYNYDHINAASLVECAVRDGMLVTKGGAQYRAMVVPPIDAVGAPVAEKLKGFASAGLPIFFAGDPPFQGDGLMEGSKQVQEAMSSLRSLASAHFCDGPASVISALKKSVKPNIRFKGEAVPFIQKRVGKINAFFLRNESDATREIEAEFDAEGKPELWDAWTGEKAPIADQRRTGDRVAVRLELQPLSSALIIFDPDAKELPANAVPAARRVKSSQRISTSGWKLMATGLVASGKTATIQRDFPALVDWSLDDELRGFSGRGVYTTTFMLPATSSGSRFILDLGTVRDVAEVKVNGKPAGTMLLRPCRVDVSEVVKPGENALEITVTNALFNCMIMRNPRPFRAGPTENSSGLMSAGLIGPVELKEMV